MKKEVNKLFIDFITRATECRNVHGKCSVELNRATIKRIVNLIGDSVESPSETSPIQKDKRTHVLFGTRTKINNKLPNNFILFRPSGRVLMLK